MTTSFSLEPREQLRRQASKLASQLGRRPEAQGEASALLKELRAKRLFPELASLAERLRVHLPDDAYVRKMLVQGLIETGNVYAALDVAIRLEQDLPADDPEWAEAVGLQGRIFKQVFMEMPDKRSADARDALEEGIAAYRRPFERNPSVNTWHGVNLLALLYRAAKLGFPTPPELRVHEIAGRILLELDKVPMAKRDMWHHASAAEAAIALGDWVLARPHLGSYLKAEGLDAFAVAGTYRQFTEVWDLESEPGDGKEFVRALRGKLVRMRQAHLDLAPERVRELRDAEVPQPANLEPVFGPKGLPDSRWWQDTLKGSFFVAAVRDAEGFCLASGFLVSAADLGLPASDQPLFLTSAAILEDAPKGGIPEGLRVIFEAESGAPSFGVGDVLFRSPRDRLDAALLRLADPDGNLGNIPPLPVARDFSHPIPDEDQTGASLHTVGYHRGWNRNLIFQAVELRTHDVQPPGSPLEREIAHLYAVGSGDLDEPAPGSPVFDSTTLEVVGIQHGYRPSLDANDSIWIQSIASALRKKAGQ
jgi:hypothetical protein